MITQLTVTQEKILYKVEQHLKEMQGGEICPLGKNHVSYENFVQCVKYLIDTAFDFDNGFVITFSADYSKIRRDNRFAFAPKIHEQIKETK